ncbi:endosomal spry domain protein [Pseudomassariella vexata]|uniref:Protein SSH4 n=1 Tax=Pseudomassariella vexata TaxID=1141098 RepID=A0A1Y2EKV7_9PEZI|nr:endosomal spry domain protein [Pseudomassariella vexata]ORY71944.1 endosomal spry domain protein [Pseudomassariella vexata]
MADWGAIIIGLLSAFGSAILIAIIFSIVYFFRYTSSGRIFLDRIGRPGEYDDEQAFAREEAEALETMDDMARTEYLRAKAFIQGNPPESIQTDISLSQYLAIQEKGVSAWEFEPELEIANCFVEARTEIEFFDSECTVMSNLPVPKQNEVYYWEAKIYDKPETTLLSIGMATKPYPLFRLPGFHKYSVAYTSTGYRRFNQPFNPTSYGPPIVQGDVIGVGYRPRTGTIFFTRNGKRLEDVAHGLKAPNFFPSVGANGPCIVHVNFGQAGFVFIEANVKKWGLAPMTGSLAPPPPYGSEQGSILLESGRKDGYSPSPGRGHGYSQSAHTYGRRDPILDTGHSRTRSGNFRILPPASPGPQRSPTDISLAQLVPSDEAGEPSNSNTGGTSGDHVVNIVGLGLQESAHPPPEYTSPEHSDDGSSTRSSSDSEQAPLIVAGRSRGASAATLRPSDHPPIPSYTDALRQGAGRDRSRSDSAMVRRRGE